MRAAEGIGPQWAPTTEWGKLSQQAKHREPFAFLGHRPSGQVCGLLRRQRRPAPADPHDLSATLMLFETIGQIHDSYAQAIEWPGLQNSHTTLGPGE
jgi:hypothetical protein